MWPGSMGNAHVRSRKPARANTSASTSVATVSPRAPCFSWSRPSSTHLCVLAWGRSRTPRVWARSAMCARLRSTTSRWSSSAGVSRSPYMSLAHDVKLGLPAQDPNHLPVGAELGVFFLRGAHRLIAPFGHGGRGLELDREPTVGQETDVAPARNAFLVIPQADQWSRTVAPVADGMGIDGARESLGAHARQRRPEDFISSPARLHFPEQDVLQPVRVPQRPLQALGDIPLAGA